MPFNVPFFYIQPYKLSSIPNSWYTNNCNTNHIKLIQLPPQTSYGTLWASLTLIFVQCYTMLLQNAPQNDENFEDAFRDDRDKLEWHANWFRYPYWCCIGALLSLLRYFGSNNLVLDQRHPQLQFAWSVRLLALFVLHGKRIFKPLV